jgi:hypothetical protein
MRYADWRANPREAIAGQFRLLQLSRSVAGVALVGASKWLLIELFVATLVGANNYLKSLGT